MAKEASIGGRKVRRASPSRMDYMGYQACVMEYNTILHSKVARALKEILPEFESECAIVTTGSDGRLEKGPVSPIEIMVLMEPGERRAQLTLKLDELASSQKFSYVFDPNWEEKDPDSDELSWYVSNRLGKTLKFVSPNRLFDAAFLYGNMFTYLSVKDRLVTELKGKKGKKVKAAMKNKVREHSKVTLSGEQKYKGEVLMHYDLNEGVAHYDEDSSLWSFKQGPIRLVQFALMKTFIAELRAGIEPGHVTDLPRNTVRKLNKLKQYKGGEFSEREFSDLGDCYTYFLWAYHHSQENYRQGQKTFEFDPRDATERCKAIHDICKSGIFKRV